MPLPQTTHGLSFSQVEEAGVFAWRPDGYIYADGRLLRVRSADSTSIEVIPSVLDADRARRRFGDAGWYHLPDCDCGTCEPLGARHEMWWDRARAAGRR
jgi:hypothetical protein